MSKIGVMGGTFDPIHNGHLALAEKAASQFNLDKVIFVTSGNPPHKDGKRILDAQMRQKLVGIATENYKKFEICDYEVSKDTYSYTVDTLNYLKKQYKKAELYFIIGADSLHNLPEWRRPREIFELCTLLIYPRDGYDEKAELEKLKKEYYCTAEFIDAPNIDISSTLIRRKLYKRKEVVGLVPRKVLKMIYRNNLYLYTTAPIEERIADRLTPDRYKHSVNVAKKAVKMAEHFGINVKQAYMAGIVHDCAKNIPEEKMKQKCMDYNVELDEYEIKNPGLIHAKLGEKVAKIELGIRDSEVLNAIKWHTLGRPEMSDLEKIIFVADMIEPGRHFRGIEELRKLAFENLDDAVEACTLATIRFNKEHNRDIHPMAYDVLKWLNKKKKEKNKKEKISENEQEAIAKDNLPAAEEDEKINDCGEENIADAEQSVNTEQTEKQSTENEQTDADVQCGNSVDSEKIINNIVEDTEKNIVSDSEDKENITE